ncbi:3-deoxy-manno-octulosonate-8-phosphatase KdsC [Agaribacter marinus]|uniref:3-deoxy-D-manno-octulosonate 8-phosphate phosphatase KdsC n=1 Tax=Agaribacter marinus TaxID=1431249 RepID=A0AA37T5X0_9ALTE|nr:3-deoxy-manno-octulosonate-8-phosphatase KdsC [Agaribacter marinus]GLR72848.1 3-deoxy-D-manno-octulosonate 8-phosphate phosphatase [Agaribacter marinus]
MSLIEQPTISTLYGPVKQSVFDACKSIKLLVLDVDGVLSDGNIYMGNSSEELKTFNTKDGYGIKAVMSAGIEVAVITGRQSSIVQQRMQSLNVKYIVQGQENKSDAIQKIMKEKACTKSNVACIGDDMPDIGLFENSYLKVAVNDAHPYIRQLANHVTTLNGGRGAVREFCDLLLLSRDLLDKQYGSSI